MYNMLLVHCFDPIKGKQGKVMKTKLKLWQIATGESGRDYRQLFFDHYLMILRPGRPGDALTVNYVRGAANSITVWKRCAESACTSGNG